VSWTLYRWTWRLESPLFVGALPAGSLNRCRLYVPARALWGALTAELARRRENGFPSYENEGTVLRENAGFTYLFPAECDRKLWRAWLPQYELGRGLIWRREDQQDCEHDLTDRQMRMKLLDARPGTAIDPDSDSAEDGSLRETECVLPQWRNNGSPVAFVGYVFLKNELATLRDVTLLFLGGDTRYGFGRVRRVGDLTSASEVFGAQVDLNQGAPSVRSNRLLAHTHQDAGRLEIIGSQESLAGWDRTKEISFQSLAETPLWNPGSRPKDGQIKDWELCEDGTWRLGGSRA